MEHARRVGVLLSGVDDPHPVAWLTQATTLPLSGGGKSKPRKQRQRVVALDLAA